MYDMIVVDADPIVRVTLAEALRDEGFRVVEAADGVEALELLADPDGISVLVTDIQLGGATDGVAVATAAMRLWPDIRVIYLTGRPDGSAALAMGAHQRMLIKPFMPSYLVKVAQEMLGHP